MSKPYRLSKGKQMLRYIAPAAAVTAALLLAGTYYVTQSGSDDQFAECRASAVAGGAKIGGPFELINGDGETVTEADVLKEPALIYFGYTFCPDVCPFDVSRNADATDIVLAGGQSVTPVFVSIDPKRDTPEAVKDYAANMHDKMIGLTGSDAQVKQASQAYRTILQSPAR